MGELTGKSKQGGASENKEITIYDIAREAEVSPATVSRVLGGRVNVRADKKQRVLELVEKYHFQPNAFARGLADTKSRIIGIMVSDIRNPYYAEMFASCEKAAMDVGYSTILCSSMNRLESEVQLLKQLKTHRVDAIIQMGGHVDAASTDIEYVESVNKLIKTTPMVTTGRLDGTRCKSVRVNSMKSMELQMEYLLGLGHRNIAIVGGDIQVLATYEKLIQYRKMLSEAGIAYDPDIVTTAGTYNMQFGYAEMNRLLSLHKKLTAVIAINDFTAAGVMQCLSEHGIRVPQDISVVSYDNTYIAQTTFPGLTTIDYNYEEYGRLLVEAAIGGGDESQPLRIVNPRLIVRKSSGKASA